MISNDTNGFVEEEEEEEEEEEGLVDGGAC